MLQPELFLTDKENGKARWSISLSEHITLIAVHAILEAAEIKNAAPSLRTFLHQKHFPAISLIFCINKSNRPEKKIFAASFFVMPAKPCILQKLSRELSEIW